VTIELLSTLQNVHDVFGKWEWRERLQSIARQFGLSAELVKAAA
jgi:NADH:ubiquinone oxidoreductase subunit E